MYGAVTTLLTELSAKLIANVKALNGGQGKFKKSDGGEIKMSEQFEICHFEITSLIQAIIKLNADNKDKLDVLLDLLVLMAQNNQHLRDLVYEYAQEDMNMAYSKSTSDLHIIKQEIISLVSNKTPQASEIA